MHYLIDGHNLIGKMADINLDDPDDEVKLILRLRSWSAIKRNRRVTVYFDHGLPGGIEKGLSSGQVKVIFAPAGRTADSLLINRISSAKNPAEFTLVTSDHRILHAAERRRMNVLRSEIFADQMSQERELREGGPAEDTGAEPQINRDEVEMWLKLFADESDDAGGE